MDQQARHQETMSKFGIIDAEQNRLFKIDFLTIIVAFLLMIIGMLLSYFLLISGLTTTGGLFGGSTLIFAALSFLNFRKATTYK
ncbi:MAG: hypothetical protein WDO14_01845 [Bacteroidota bacterium]